MGRRLNAEDLMMVRQGRLVTIKCMRDCKHRDESDGPTCAHPGDGTWVSPVKGRKCPNYVAKETSHG